QALNSSPKKDSAQKPSPASRTTKASTLLILRSDFAKNIISSSIPATANFAEALSVFPTWATKPKRPFPICSRASTTSSDKSEGRPRFRRRPSYLDGGKPNSVVDDHLSQSRLRGTARCACALRDATIPEA